MKLGPIAISDRTFFKIAFVLSALMLFFIAAVSFNQLNKVNAAQKRVILSRERQVELAKLYSYVKDAETLQRAYLLTNDSAFLNSYFSTQSKSRASLAKLKSLCGGNPLRHQDLKKLQNLIEHRFSLAGNALQASAKEATRELLNTNFREGLQAMQHVGALVNQISLNEDAALRVYEKLHTQDNKFLPYFTGALVLFCILVLLLSFYKMSKDNRKSRKMNYELRVMNNTFLHAEEMAEMGHWQRNLTTFEIKSSANMYRLLGFEPFSVPYTEDTLLNLVHPEDRRLLVEAFDKIKLNKQSPDLVYRIIRGDGTVRYLRSEARYVMLDDIPMMLGATRDVTTEVENKRHIEDKNRQLEQIVTELASFNHVASHDLQEPLRKIQVFISRILDEDSHTLSANAKDYFERITASADRMEMLIDDLLLYSETGKENQVFETTDLNAVLEEVKQELADEIEAKCATITIGQLPSVPVIPFQLQQLFINLIGNALKYCTPDVPPAIGITCSIVKKHYDGDKPKHYYEIAVTDNGIGFPQEFAEKIFVLFQRLHSKTKYSGTGIGLAICKKIAENHNGYINAVSTPGNGATFCLYLPK